MKLAVLIIVILVNQVYGSVSEDATQDEDLSHCKPDVFRTCADHLQDGNCDASNRDISGFPFRSMRRNCATTCGYCKGGRNVKLPAIPDRCAKNSSDVRIYHPHKTDKCKYLYEVSCPEGMKWDQVYLFCVNMHLEGETCPTDTDRDSIGVYLGPPSPIVNPAVPFIREIPFVMSPKKFIYVVGIPDPDANRLIVNIGSGPSMKDDDIAFHLSVRFKLNKVVLNNRIQGVYGKEKKPTDFPFTPNVPYEIKIICGPSSFKIAVNNEDFAEFSYRIVSLQTLTHLSVQGDTRVILINFGPEGEDVDGETLNNYCRADKLNICSRLERKGRCDASNRQELWHRFRFMRRNCATTCGYCKGGRNVELPLVKDHCTNESGIHHRHMTNKCRYLFEKSCPEGQKWSQDQKICVDLGGETCTTDRPVYPPAPIFNPPVPVIAEIPNGMSRGKAIYILGVPTPDARHFSVNIMNGPNFEENDMALHFSVRFNTDSSNVVVITNRIQETFSREWRLTNPFTPNVPYEIKILCGQSSFEIAVNKEDFAEFSYRTIPLSYLTRLIIWQDTRVRLIRFE